MFIILYYLTLNNLYNMYYCGVFAFKDDTIIH